MGTWEARGSTRLQEQPNVDVIAPHVFYFIRILREFMIRATLDYRSRWYLHRKHGSVEAGQLKRLSVPLNVNERGSASNEYGLDARTCQQES